MNNVYNYYKKLINYILHKYETYSLKISSTPHLQNELIITFVYIKAAQSRISVYKAREKDIRMEFNFNLCQCIIIISGYNSIRSARSRKVHT